MTKQRPKILRGFTQKAETELGTLYATFTIDPDTRKPLEVFCQIGKAGSSVSADGEAMGRLVSLSLRNGVDMEEIRQQLQDIASDAAGDSIPAAIAEILSDFSRCGGILLTVTEAGINRCPHCGSGTLTFLEGPEAVFCHACGSRYRRSLEDKVI